jgi:hypothetical protein
VGELTKDKYLALLLCVILLGAYVYTRDAIIQTLLVTSVGGFLGLVRSSTGVTGIGSPGVTINQPTVKETA